MYLILDSHLCKKKRKKNTHHPVPILRISEMTNVLPKSFSNLNFWTVIMLSKFKRANYVNCAWNEFWFTQKKSVIQNSLDKKWIFIVLSERIAHFLILKFSLSYNRLFPRYNFYELNFLKSLLLFWLFVFTPKKSEKNPSLF